MLRTNILFFDSNPSGRIITRFAKDMVVLDLVLPPVVTFATSGMFRAASVAISVAVVNPYVVIAIAAALLIMVYIIRVATKAMLQA